MPMLRLCTGTRVMRSPFSRMSPELGDTRPAIMRRHVVLPQPLGPSSATMLPGSIVNDTSSTAVTRWYCLLSACKRTSAEFMDRGLAGEELVVAFQHGRPTWDDEVPVGREQAHVDHLALRVGE